MSIEVENLSMIYGDVESPLTVFENLSFSVEQGSKVAIIGASGVGKTSLLYLIGGLDRPSSGQVKICGALFNNSLKENDELASFRQKNIGFIFQFHHLLPEFTAVENVAMPLILKDGPKPEHFEAAKEILARLGLGKRFQHKPTMLSGGEQQRVAIARAFAIRPKVVLADEPTGNLDRGTADEVFSVLNELTQETNTTLLVVTHSELLASRMDSTLELRQNSLIKKNFLNDLI